MYKSPYYPDSTFKCRDNCGLGIANMTEKHLRNLDFITKEIGKPLPTSSAVRCEKHNKAVGGELHSEHLIGNATDHPIEDDETLYRVISIAMLLGMGVGVRWHGNKRFVHLDSGKKRFFTYQ